MYNLENTLSLVAYVAVLNSTKSYPVLQFTFSILQNRVAFCLVKHRRSQTVFQIIHIFLSIILVPGSSL